MNDILIKGMELPKGDEPRHILIYSDGKVCTDNGHHDFELSFATAIKLPEHGRLVQDTDVKALVFSGISFDKNPISIIEDYIDKLPTIVEANNE